jgi:RNA polymerase sigma-70 factor (ECF subfamily)
LPAFDRSGHHAATISRWNAPSDDAVLSEESRALVRQSIDRLPEDHRVVLLLRDIENLSTEETAIVLGISAGAVKTRLHRARQALRTLLDPHFSG